MLWGRVSFVLIEHDDWFTDVILVNKKQLVIQVFGAPDGIQK